MSKELRVDSLDENPFSFKKFIKTNVVRSELESVSGGGGSAIAPDPIDFHNQNVNATLGESCENPFSYKNFLQSCEESKDHIISVTCGTLSKDLPDFDQGYCVNDQKLPGNQIFPSVTLTYLSDIGIDSTCGTNELLSDRHPYYYDSIGVVLPEGHDHTCSVCSVTTDCHKLFINSGEDKSSVVADFASDSDLDIFNSPANIAHTVKDEHLGFDDALTAFKESRPLLFIQQLQEENRELRQQLLKTRAVACRESSRVKQLLKDTDRAHKHEMDETAALEKMIQQVEGNLQATLQRAINAENSIMKLKQEIKTLKSFSSSLVVENEMLKNENCNSLKEKSTFAAEQITAAITNAEQLLKQLLSGVDNLKMVAKVLSSVDQIKDISLDEMTDQ